MSTLSWGTVTRSRVTLPRAAGMRPGWVEVLHQVMLFAAGMVVYFGVRGLTESNIATAQAHAEWLVALERKLGLFVEPALQAKIADHSVLVTLANWVYIWGHWPVVLGILVWLLLRRPDSYYLIRNAFLISGLIGVTIFVLFPMAPPRLAGLDVVDTVTRYSHSYRVLQPPAFVNQYAAMPSLHFGWDLIVGIMLFREARHLPLKVAGVLAPIAMAMAVVLTANHYILDIVVGGAVALTGLALATAWRDRHQPVREPELAREELAPA